LQRCRERFEGGVERLAESGVDRLFDRREVVEDGAPCDVCLLSELVGAELGGAELLGERDGGLSNRAAMRAFHPLVTVLGRNIGRGHCSIVSDGALSASLPGVHPEEILRSASTYGNGLRVHFWKEGTY